MSAMEKVAWTELVVSLVVSALVVALFPWLGMVSLSAFALMALITLSGLLLRRRGNEVVVDERDRDIERRAIRIAASVSWMCLLGGLIISCMWSAYVRNNAVPTSILSWLVWTQFPIIYGIKGFMSIYAYRRESHYAA